MKTKILMLLLSSVLSLGLVWAVSELAHAEGVAAGRSQWTTDTRSPALSWHALAVMDPALIAGSPEIEPAVATSPAVAPDPDTDPTGFIEWSFAAIRSKNGWLIASVLVVIATWLLRLGVRKRTGFLAWFATDRGGVILTAIVATLGGFAHAAAAGRAPTWQLAVVVVEAWVGAIGLYVAFKRVAKPRDQGAAAA